MKPSVPLIVRPAAMGGFTVHECPYVELLKFSSKVEFKDVVDLAGKPELFKFLDRHFRDWNFHSEGKC